jgi:branched-subunit amino acid aminotransferase/4-amino-4-deoxychorismate lyase
VVSGGVIRTPPLESGLLAGITRQFVLELCREEGIFAEEVTLHDADLLEADEVFITSSTREIVPVVRVDHTTIGSGKPGATTTRLIAAFGAAVDRLCPAAGVRS